MPKLNSHNIELLPSFVSRPRERKDYGDVVITSTRISLKVNFVSFDNIFLSEFNKNK